MWGFVWLYNGWFYLTTLLNEKTGMGGPCLDDWGQSRTLITISMSGNFFIMPRIKCSTPLHLYQKKKQPFTVHILGVKLFLVWYLAILLIIIKLCKWVTCSAYHKYTIFSLFFFWMNKYCWLFSAGTNLTNIHYLQTLKHELTKSAKHWHAKCLIFKLY